MQASAARSVQRALAATTFVAALGVAPMIPSASGPTATDVLARVTDRDARVDSYSVPVHMDVRVHKLFTFHIGLNGTQYYKRPDRVALDMRQIPAQYRKLFADLGTPLTWPGAYDLKLVGSNGDRGPFRLEGTPRHPSDIARMQADARLVHDEERVDERRAETGRQIDALHLAAAQGARGTIER